MYNPSLEKTTTNQKLKEFFGGFKTNDEQSNRQADRQTD